MIVYSEEFGKKVFEGPTRKEAYLSAAKWVASNVLSKDELQNTLVKFEKDKQFPTITVRLYVTIDDTEIKDEHCKICKETHSSFFINENYNCSRCNSNSYQRRIDAVVRVKKEYYRGVMRKGQE